MKVYLVGGAVRDELLGRAVKDRDYVVVGATPQDMLDLGYKQVGADFPVFLCENGEEYALARTERKTGRGYQGFAVDFDPSITLEDDLKRRDLTINAMARDLETGEIVDPFGGQNDLRNQVLRHVSEAFAEDPLRVLRVARFRARYDFAIAHETVLLMQQLVDAGEMEQLTPERVWVEVEKGLTETFPLQFVVSLMIVGAWKRLFPEIVVKESIHNLNSVPKDSGFNGALMVVFADTDSDQMLKVLEKYKASSNTITTLLAFKTLQHASLVANDMAHILNALKLISAYNRPEVLKEIVNAAPAIPDHFNDFMRIIFHSYCEVKDIKFASLTAEQQATLKGKEIGEAIDAERLKKLVG